MYSLHHSADKLQFLIQKQLAKGMTHNSEDWGESTLVKRTDLEVKLILVKECLDHNLLNFIHPYIWLALCSCISLSRRTWV